jgi:hypothetical protein
MGFKRGDKVIVTGVTLYGSFEGCEGVIIRDSQFHDWLVDVTFPDGSHDELGFDAHELATPPQEPAPVSAAGEVVHDLDSLDYAMAMLGSEFVLAGNYDKVAHHFKAIDQWKADTEAELAAAEALAETLRGERDAAVAALRPFAFAYHVFNDQFASDYGNIINWQTDFANPNKVTEWYKQASEVVGVDDAKAANAPAVDGEGDAGQ